MLSAKKKAGAGIGLSKLSSTKKYRKFDQGSKTGFQYLAVDMYGNNPVRMEGGILCNQGYSERFITGPVFLRPGDVIKQKFLFDAECLNKCVILKDRLKNDGSTLKNNIDKDVRGLAFLAEFKSDEDVLKHMKTKLIPALKNLPPHLRRYKDTDYPNLNKEDIIHVPTWDCILPPDEIEYMVRYYSGNVEAFFKESQKNIYNCFTEGKVPVFLMRKYNLHGEHLRQGDIANLNKANAEDAIIIDEIRRQQSDEGSVPSESEEHAKDDAKQKAPTSTKAEEEDEKKQLAVEKSNPPAAAAKTDDNNNKKQGAVAKEETPAQADQHVEPTNPLEDNNTVPLLDMEGKVHITTSDAGRPTDPRKNKAVVTPEKTPEETTDVNEPPFKPTKTKTSNKRAITDDDDAIPDPNTKRVKAVRDLSELMHDETEDQKHLHHGMIEHEAEEAEETEEEDAEKDEIEEEEEEYNEEEKEEEEDEEEPEDEDVDEKELEELADTDDEEELFGDTPDDKTLTQPDPEVVSESTEDKSADDSTTNGHHNHDLLPLSQKHAVRTRRSCRNLNVDQGGFIANFNLGDGLHK